MQAGEGSLSGSRRIRGASTLEAALGRERAVIVAALAGVVVVAWAYILAGAGLEMPVDAPDGTPGVMAPMAWTPGYAVLVFFMWWVMMIAMMLPSAAPMILLFATLDRGRRGRGASVAPAGAFALGYLVAWGGFSLVAAALQWGLGAASLLSPAMASTSAVLGGVILAAAGVYQLTPLKQACLRHCRAPFLFLSQRWRAGRLGAIRMGIEHGAFCLGCCWVLMGLLFVGGVMNPYWIVGLAVFVLLEKTIPAGRGLGWLGGGALIAWGVAMIAIAL